MYLYTFFKIRFPNKIFNSIRFLSYVKVTDKLSRQLQSFMMASLSLLNTQQEQPKYNLKTFLEQREYQKQNRKTDSAIADFRIHPK